MLSCMNSTHERVTLKESVVIDIGLIENVCAKHRSGRIKII